MDGQGPGARGNRGATIEWGRAADPTAHRAWLGEGGTREGGAIGRLTAPRPDLGVKRLLEVTNNPRNRFLFQAYDRLSR